MVSGSSRRTGSVDSTLRRDDGELAAVGAERPEDPRRLVSGRTARVVAAQQPVGGGVVEVHPVLIVGGGDPAAVAD